MQSTLIASVLAASLALVANAQATDPAAIARQALDRLDAGEYAQVEQSFGAQMAAAVPADKLKAVWESLPAQVGKATGRGAAEASAQGDATLVRVPLHYEKAELMATFAIDGAGKITGFVVQPAQSAAPAPTVAADAPHIERDLPVGDGERALPGTLAMPKGDGPFPAVVLVHGSGAHDRDETIGPNKPFLDIARGLAAQGIAVLRYEKRSKARPQDFTSGPFGVDEETTFDGVLAVDALSKTAGIDPKRVFVLGHSQGGMMAPRIAAKSGHVAGLAHDRGPVLPVAHRADRRSARQRLQDRDGLPVFAHGVGDIAPAVMDRRDFGQHRGILIALPALFLLPGRKQFLQ